MRDIFAVFLIGKFSNFESVTSVIEEETVYHTSLRSFAFSVPIQLGVGAPFGRSTLLTLQVYESAFLQKNTKKNGFFVSFVNKSIQDFTDGDASKEPKFS